MKFKCHVMELTTVLVTVEVEASSADEAAKVAIATKIDGNVGERTRKRGVMIDDKVIRRIDMQPETNT